MSLKVSVGGLPITALDEWLVGAAFCIGARHHPTSETITVPLWSRLQYSTNVCVAIKHDDTIHHNVVHFVDLLARDYISLESNNANWWETFARLSDYTVMSIVSSGNNNQQ